MWADLHSMPDAHPLAQLIRRRAYKRYLSPMQKIAESAEGTPVNELEATRPYISAPWDTWLNTVDSIGDGVQAAARAQETQGICVATSTSARNQLVGIGGVGEGIDWMSNDNQLCEYDRTLGAGTHIDAYTAALASIEVGLDMVDDAVYAGALLPRAHGQTIDVFTNNRTVGRGSGQTIVGKILKLVRYLEGFSNRVIFAWAPVNPIFALGQRAKHLAQRATDEGRVVQDRVRLSKRSVQNAQERLRRAASQESTTFRESVRRVDAAW
jgi:hypothetical protein